MPRKVILIDQDGVIADYERSFFEEWKRKFPEIPAIPLNQRTNFYPEKQYPEQQALSIVLSKGFYRDLPVIPGALEAIKELEKYAKLFICTSPKTRNPFCVQEKYEWIIQYLGKSWLERTVVAKDKTAIRGDLLVDDRQEVKGRFEPTWRHVIYKQPFNTGTFTWQNWRELLK